MGQTSTIGRAGEFYAAAVLSRHGLWATPFSGNLPGYDLVAITPGGQLRLIQVKTSGPSSNNKKIGSWWLGKPGHASGASKHFWIFVDLIKNVPEPRYYVVPEATAVDLHHADGPGWGAGWTGWEEGDLLPFENRWDLLHEGDPAVGG